MFKFIRKLLTGLLVLVMAFLAYRNFGKKEVILIGHDSARISAYPYYEILGSYNIELTNYDPRSPGGHNFFDADGYIFMGGNDFDPGLYGSDSYDLVEYYNRNEDLAELEVLDYAIKNKKPILGICRGMQLINIYYGGTLYEDLKSQFSSSISHRAEGAFAYHQINIEPDSRLSFYIASPSYEVNSYHHQAIRDLAEGLRPAAFAPDGLIEAIENPYYDSFMLGLQRHPEGSSEDPLTREIFKDFARSL